MNDSPRQFWRYIAFDDPWPGSQLHAFIRETCGATLWQQATIWTMGAWGGRALVKITIDIPFGEVR